MASRPRRTRHGAGYQVRATGGRVLDAWGVLEPDQRLAAAASIALFISMFLPWYQQNAVVTASHAGTLVSRNLTAFGVFSFVEAAVLLVAVAVLALLFARAESRAFHLPGSDGTIVMIGGGWTALLLVYRLFDKPGVIRHGVAADVGVQWGIFFALIAAGMLTYAGSRMRGAQRPEAPLLRSHDRRDHRDPEPPGSRPPDRPRAVEDAGRAGWNGPLSEDPTGWIDPETPRDRRRRTSSVPTIISEQPTVRVRDPSEEITVRRARTGFPSSSPPSPSLPSPSTRYREDPAPYPSRSDSAPSPSAPSPSAPSPSAPSPSAHSPSPSGPPVEKQLSLDEATVVDRKDRVRPDRPSPGRGRAGSALGGVAGNDEEDGRHQYHRDPEDDDQV